MSKSDDEKERIHYGITPSAFLGCGLWLVILLLVPLIVHLLQWIFK